MSGGRGIESYLAHILMKEVEGERVKGGVANVAKRYIWGTEKREPIMILRGELVNPITPQERDDGNPPHNYCVQKDQSVTFYSVEDNVSPLHYTNYKLLQAIESVGDRHAVFADNQKLEWGGKLKQGDDVFVRLSSPHSNPDAAEWSHARILYKGSVQSLPGTMFGVEIMDGRYRGRGLTNGWFQDQYYFQCEDDCGLFVSLDKLEPQPPPGSDLPQQGNIVSSVVPPKPQDAPLALNDRVYVYNNNSVPYRGNVRWIGNKTNTRALGTLYAGIETELPVFSSDFVGSIPGMSGLFHAKDRHHLVVPLSMLTRDNSLMVRSSHVPHGAAPREDHIPNPTALARDLGTTKRQLMSDQQKVLKEGEKLKLAEANAKKNKSFEQVIEAIGESITASEQQRILDKIKRENELKGGAHEGNTTLPQPRGANDPSRQDSNQPLTKQRLWQEQGHIYERIPGDSSSAKRRLAEQWKAARSADLLQEPHHGQNFDQGLRTQPNQFQGSQQHPTSGQQQFAEQENKLRGKTISSDDDVKLLQKQLSEEKKERESLQQQFSSKTKQFNQLKSDNTRLRQENTRLQEQLTQQKTESQQQIEQERAVAAEEKQRMINSHSQAEQQFRSQLSQMETHIQELQQQLDSVRAESGKAGYSSVQVPPEDQDFLNVARDAVKITGEIGRGASGVVLKGRFRGQPVAVKQVHRALLQQSYTIPQMRREIQIMASVQHPNLVRFIAAVIDNKVDRGEDTPLLVLEMLDMDLRHAYKTTDLGTNKISIFRDVAYALHYLHEHQEPIIHRDLSAPNVLLQCLQGGTYRAKLSDFGSANKAKDARTAGLGAICYTAPEAFPPVDIEAPVPPQTPKIDVYSFGILLAEVVTKTMPTTENRRQLLHEIKRTWELMYDLICSCTKPTPSDRPTMASILNTLYRIPTPRPRQVSN